MNHEPTAEKIIQSLQRQQLEFAIRPIATHRMLITVHSDTSPVGFNCVLDIMEGALNQVNFLIRFSSKLTIDESPDILLFAGLANSHRNIHPGYWNYDIDEGELIYCYQWHCDPTGNQFEEIFDDLLTRCFASFDNARDALKALVEGKINAEQAVGEFIKRTTAFFN